MLHLLPMSRLLLSLIACTTAAHASSQAPVYLKPSNPGGGDRFGEAVAASGDLVAVGAPGEASSSQGPGGDETDDSAPSSGAAYVFVQSAGTPVQVAYLKASNAEPGDEFGSSIALDGDLLVVGAPGEASQAAGVDGDASDNSIVRAGAAYVFRRINGVWIQEAYLKHPAPGANHEFGGAVAVSGDRVAVGARADESNATGVNGDPFNTSANNAGAACVFVFENGAWSQEAYIKASNTAPASYFGESLALDGTTLAVGSPRESNSATGVGGNQQAGFSVLSGAVYIFERGPSGWTQQAYVKASNTGAFDEFGGSIDVGGDSVVVGARFEGSLSMGVDGDQQNNAGADVGAAYVFQRTGGTWTQQAYLKASNSETGDLFGTDVAVAGERVLVSATGEASAALGLGGDESDNGALFAGAVYGFLRSGQGWSQEAYIKAGNTDSQDRFGASVDLTPSHAVVGASGEASAEPGPGAAGTDNSAPEAGASYSLPLDGGDVGQAYCGPATPNSTGLPAELSAQGSAAAAANDLTLVASQLPPNVFGYFLVSPVQGFAPGAGGSAGNLCLAGPIGRFLGPGQVMNSGANGRFSLALDLTAVPTPNGITAVAAGETWNFQAWTRDVLAGVPTSNFTPGLEVAFL